MQALFYFFYFIFFIVITVLYILYSYSQLKIYHLREDNLEDELDDDELELNEAGENKSEKKHTKPEHRKQAKKPPIVEKNNGSILNFFQKTQKRPLSNDQACLDVVSHFLLNRKLKICKDF
jgi:regulatory protein YycI of two-component signal transduction system YycFG